MQERTIERSRVASWRDRKREDHYFSTGKLVSNFLLDGESTSGVRTRVGSRNRQELGSNSTERKEDTEKGEGERNARRLSVEDSRESWGYLIAERRWIEER